MALESKRAAKTQVCERRSLGLANLAFRRLY